jgi:hypothetical protein
VVAILQIRYSLIFSPFLFQEGKTSDQRDSIREQEME